VHAKYLQKKTQAVKVIFSSEYLFIDIRQRNQYVEEDAIP